MKKQILLPAAVVTIIAGSYFGAQSVSAHGFSNDSSSLVQTLATRFNLDESQVKAVFDEIREQKKAQRQTQLQEKLQKAVESGKLTEEQKVSLIQLHEAHRAEVQALYDADSEVTPEQRRLLFEKFKNTLNEWAEKEGVSIEALQSTVGRFGSRHQRMK